jgi:transposase-like protein
MALDLTAPEFHDTDKAREWLEAYRWPTGAYCPHCGAVDGVSRMGGTGHRPGLMYCRACKGQFTVLTGSVMESSHIPLPKWVLAIRLMTSSKKGVSAHQVHRSLGITYKSAWFLCHRIREAMRDENPAPIGGEGKIVEADEAYHGKRETPRAPSPQRKGRPYTKGGKSGGGDKRPIVALVERGGEARAVHMNHITGKDLRDYKVRNASRKSRLHTDESKLYPSIGKEFATHETVNHSAKEYARGDVTTNSAEGFFGIFKRGMVGVYQHCGEQHLQRYLDEFTFRYNNRIRLGVDDAQRATIATYGMSGKRLTYRRISEA